MSKKIIVTHSGKYHADDLFAVASLQILLGEENTEVLRTRDPKEISKGDYVVDVGGVYNSEEEKFDHHQTAGAGVRENSIPYASFGLVWKKYGEILTGGSKESLCVDQKMIQPIDAGDNGYDVYTLNKEKVLPYEIQTMLASFMPTWQEDQNPDDIFRELLPLARKILNREIELAKQFVKVEKQIEEKYQNTENKRIVVFDKNQPFGRQLVWTVLCKYAEPIFAILYQPDKNLWQTLAIKKEVGLFELRLRLPAKWGGNKTKVELQELTGYPDVVFVHSNGFMALSESKETALALAKQVLGT